MKDKNKGMPFEGIKDVDAFQSWLTNEQDLSVSTIHNYRNALKRFYYFTSKKYGRTERINLDTSEKIGELKKQLENFIVSRGSELGMKKYVEYRKERSDEASHAEEIRRFIHSLEYEAEDELEISLN
jgi:hypothetical protein